MNDETRPGKKTGSKAAKANKRTRKTEGDPAKTLQVVGVGASAGGLEALQPMIAHLPRNASCAYILPQHVGPTHRSMLVELLSRSTQLQVREIENGVGMRAGVVGGILQLGNGLGIAVTAEGVERQGQLQHLAEIGCRSVQGYLMSLPMPAEEVTAFLRRDQVLPD